MNRLDRIAGLTDVIEERVMAGDWAGARALDEERRILLEEVCATGLPLTGALRGTLEQLRARNEQTIASLAATRSALTPAAATAPPAARALRAYARQVADSPTGMAGE